MFFTKENIFSEDLGSRQAKVAHAVNFVVFCLN